MLNTDSSHLLDSGLGLVFVDASIDDAQALMGGIVDRWSNNQMLFVSIDAESDGIQKITETLAQYDSSFISAIHIISHGESGSLQLGNTVLDSNTLASYSDDLLGWRDSLTEEADLLFYGCNVAAGSTGQDFVNQIAYWTGADVVASSDLTGSRLLGGDADLEYATGAIEASIILDADLLNQYGGVFLIGEATGTGNLFTFEESDWGVESPLIIDGLGGIDK